MSSIEKMLSRELESDPRRGQILKSAMGVFMTYGFARTTMDDIARASGMSRPALYIVFKNKKEIFRAIAVVLFDGTLKAAEGLLSADGSLETRMGAAVETAMVTPVAEISDAPHGAELLDAKTGLADDIAEDWRQRFCGLIAAAITAEAERNGAGLRQRGLSADGLAAIVVDGIEGAKQRAASIDEVRRIAGELVRLVSLAAGEAETLPAA